MLKVRKAVQIFIIVLIQSTFAISAGAAAIYLTTGNTLPPGIHAGNIDIGGMGRTEAVMKVEEYYNSILGKESLQIALEGGSKYSIAYSDFDAVIDSDATVNSFRNWRSASYLPNLMKAFFGREKVAVQPVVKFDEGKLRQKLIELSQKINKEPVNASINIVSGKIVKKAETSGLTLNVSNAVEVIRKCISENIGSSVSLSSSKNFEIQTVPAKIKMKDLNDVDQIIAEYSTEIIDPELINSIKLSADAINGVVIPSGSDVSVEEETFSFVDWLKKQDTDFENDNEGYDQVASTLYAALLTSGMRKDSITRLPHKLTVEYIDPGLDAWISGSAGDLKFTNTLGHKLAVFTEIKDDKLTIRLAGNFLDKKEAYVLRAEIEQKLDPPVVTVENKDLKTGEKVMLSPGKQGMTVSIYRNQELISTDRYEAVRAIVQVGPKTDWNSENEK